MQKYKNHIQYLNYILIGQKTTRILFLALIVGFCFFFVFFFKFGLIFLFSRKSDFVAL